MKEFRSRRLRVWENINRTMQEFKVLLLGYRSYTALLTQTGTDAPVATVLENTLGGEITYEYWVDESPGSYKILSNGLFNGNIFITQLNNISNELITFEKISESEIHIFTTNDNLITSLPLEIRVYN